MVAGMVCVILAGASVGGTAWPAPPDPSRYAPNIFWRSDDEQFRIIDVITRTWHDGKSSGISYRWLSGLPPHCWAVEYIYVWNDESASQGHRRGDEDPESIIVFVDDAGNTVGVQSRLHGGWLPINSSLMPWDFEHEGHVKLAFAANVHTPGAGLLHSIGLLTAGRAPQWIAEAFASGVVPNVDWVAAATELMNGLIREDRVRDGGYRYAMRSLGLLSECPY